MMKNVLLLLTLGASALVVGCSSPCDALQDVCNKCKDSTTKAACDQTVSTYKAVPVSGETACQAVLDQKTYSSCQ